MAEDPTSKVEDKSKYMHAHHFFSIMLKVLASAKKEQKA